jgi:thiamine biosynthesis protein ThiS
LPLADEVVAWLGSHRPASPPPTLVHNDWRLDNMAVAADDPGRCVAVYDWDMCTVGDPLTDLGRHPRTVAVEHNGAILPRHRYDATPLAAGDRIEIVGVVQGG